MFCILFQFQKGIQTSDKDFLDPVSLAQPPTSNMARLHSKLQAAARRISRLSQEKDQLIQMGNRLRAELAKYTGKVLVLLAHRLRTNFSYFLHVLEK